MAWTERDASGYYFVCFRIGDKRFKRSLKTKDHDEATDLASRVRHNLRLVEQGDKEIPAAIDIVSFLLSDGKVNGQVNVPEQITLRDLFVRYFAGMPEGHLEQSTLYTMKLHQKRLEQHFKTTFLIRTLSIEHVQSYIEKRSKDQGRHGKVTAETIRKAVVTLRTVWNFGVQNKLVEGRFPSKGLKYPKAREKPPYMPFRDIQMRAKGMADAEAAELWECVFLPKDDLADLLGYVEDTARLRFIHPAFVFAAHTGARRSEVARVRIVDVDLKSGFVTIRERKRAHGKKTTRRVPMSKLLKTVLKKWLDEHPGGTALFCHTATVARSKKRSSTTGHQSKGRAKGSAARIATVTDRQPLAPSALTRDELHDHFKRTLANSEWKNLRGWHTLRHSFISVLAEAGTPQNIIDEFSGHVTEEQRRRYRHLLPSSTKKAIASVFG